ncbi:AraC family transcriptional regulator [Enterococcus hulanensis]|uniref:AraC family transcriptional regulator n=1 Tax=Enterococcus hulanensis TaxID=2559929 RepID=A0ABU3EX55_9ENTE|nr:MULTISPECIES: AraC family transcriptional regulator [Enterococcus]MBX8935516.1 AraC family transcriptional regulator [Enterococcus gilvus]MDT2598531.1 AraC family transcriptional regulator [Enterococcus hulanensis]MDT2607964.1 AraC family transcriptional regulator [Enterococcus hulanensis]MDT2615259.1 AraC family transcriptional regulator [Enterococcus hulanensis]MDT2626770.1 AraC family transcriptional regulator [Enterococcus hulanensis]
MKLEELKDLLLQENEIEKIQRTKGYNVNDQHLPFEEVEIPKMPSSSFFKEGNIFINKHHRYSEMPKHTHEFVEFNYMLSGSCTQYVNEKKVVLNEGEIILLDKDIVQRIDPLGQNDLLINILLKDESITTDIIINMVKSTGLVNEFLMNASNKSGAHDAFIHFHCGKNDEVQEIIHNLILEYFQKKRYFMRAANLLLSLLLIELTRMIEEESLDNYQKKDEEIINILKYIDVHFRHLSLKDLADEFGYNPNYMGNKLKKETGRTFQDLINSAKYQTALELMKETDKSIEEIAYEVGFYSLPSLYKLFARFTEKTPKQVKTQIIKNEI